MGKFSQVADPYTVLGSNWEELVTKLSSWSKLDPFETSF